MKNFLIGIGCSWTQGEGGYTDDIWQQYNGRVNLRGVPDAHLRPTEHENSWVNVLCRDHLTGFTPLNLGVRGIGNRASMKQLYITDEVDWDNDKGIIVFMMSGLERFDFFTQNIDAHNKFYTMWPHINDDNPNPLWKIYLEELYSDKMICMEAFGTLMEIQNFVQAHPNFKLVIANAFYPEHIPNFILNNLGEKYFKKIDWSNYLHTNSQRPNFVLELVRLDGKIPENEIQGYWSVYQSKKWPERHLTNCIHPNIDGYKYIAKELYNYIIEKKYV